MREPLKDKMRQMVGILSKESADRWKQEKEEYLVEKYQLVDYEGFYRH